VATFEQLSDLHDEKRQFYPELQGVKEQNYLPRVYSILYEGKQVPGIINQSLSISEL
jgi:hypothetical protein